MDNSFDYVQRIIPSTETMFVVPAAAPAAYTGPGDVVGSATAFWGLRAYTLASIGTNAVRLRESGGNTEQDFATIAGGGLDLAAIAAFKGANNLFVVTLYDQVGTNHLTQTTAGNQPSFTLSGLGSLPVITTIYTAPTTWVQSSTFSLAQPITCSWVAKRTARTVNSGVIANQVNTLQTGFGNASGLVFIYGNNYTTAAATEGAWIAGATIWNGASSQLNVDGAGTSANESGAIVAEFITVPGQAAGNALDGNFAEVGLWPTNFSGTQVTNMSTNQHTYWGF